MTNRKQRLRMKMKAREFDTDEIKKGMLKTLALLVTQRYSPRFKDRVLQYHMLRNELKARGYQVLRHNMPMGMVLEMMPSHPEILLALPDYHAMAPCSMEIPSIDRILSAPLPSDLPKHGYLVG